MPTYIYSCQNCGKEFSVIMSMREHEEAKIACPKCKSTEVKQQMTAFVSKTSRKS